MERIFKTKLSHAVRKKAWRLLCGTHAREGFYEIVATNCTLAGTPKGPKSAGKNLCCNDHEPLSHYSLQSGLQYYCKWSCIDGVTVL